MANAKVIIGATGGEIRISEGPGSTGAPGFGTLYVSSSDNKPHFVDTSGNDSSMLSPIVYDSVSTQTLVNPAGGNQVFGSDCSIVIGKGNILCNTTGDSWVVIGNDNIKANSFQSAKENIIIGARSCIHGVDYGCNIAIGVLARAGYTSGAIAIGYNAFTGAGLAIGPNTCAQDGARLIGGSSCINGSGSIGYGNILNSVGCWNSLISGCSTNTSSFSSMLGHRLTNTANCSVVIGVNSCNTHIGSVILGNSLTSERTNTVHVNNLLALGQGVSKGHDVGATAGSVAIDWDNSNTQKVTMTGNITSLSLSNPIQGGVYSLIIEQGNATANTITWPTGAIKWPGGTPPALTTGATGSTDIISLIYDPAGGTAYYGNSNANFS